MPAQVQAARRASRLSGSNTNAHSEVGGITSRQILWGPDADSLAVLLNDIHRDAKGFVERGVEPETSWQHPPYPKGTDVTALE